MNSSPISSWEGAQAYFTFADNPWVIGFLFALAVVVTLAVVGVMVAHEKHSFDRMQNPD